MKGTLPQRVRLGVFELDLRAGELRQDESAVLVLPDQPLLILRMQVIHFVPRVSRCGSDVIPTPRPGLERRKTWAPVSLIHAINSSAPFTKWRVSGFFPPNEHSRHDCGWCPWSSPSYNRPNFCGFNLESLRFLLKRLHPQICD